MSTDVTAQGARRPDRLACVGIDLTPEERSAYDLLGHQIEKLEPRLKHHRSARRGLARATEQRRALLERCAGKGSLRDRLSPRSAPYVLFFAIGTVEDPRDADYDGRLDQAQSRAKIHQLFHRGASPDAIDAFIDGNDWVSESPAAPAPGSRHAVTSVAVHNLLPRGVRRSRWWHRSIVEPVRADDLPPFVRLSLPVSDVCAQCGRPVGWMHWCLCPTSVALAH